MPVGRTADHLSGWVDERRKTREVLVDCRSSLRRHRHPKPASLRLPPSICQPAAFPPVEAGTPFGVVSTPPIKPRRRAEERHGCAGCRHVPPSEFGATLSTDNEAEAGASETECPRLSTKAVSELIVSEVTLAMPTAELAFGRHHLGNVEVLPVPLRHAEYGRESEARRRRYDLVDNIRVEGDGTLTLAERIDRAGQGELRKNDDVTALVGRQLHGGEMVRKVRAILVARDCR